MTVWTAVAALTLALLAAPGVDAKQPTLPAHETATKVDLNSATQAELENLPGVGEATAKKIIAGRPYASTGDLPKAGVSAATIKKITPLIIVGSPAAAVPTPTQAEKADVKAENKGRGHRDASPGVTTGATVDLNTATQQELEALPGVGAATAKKILAGRPYASVNDLSKAGVSGRTMKQIGALVVVGTAAPAAAAASIPTVPVQPSMPSPARTNAPAQVSTTSAVPPPAAGMVWVNLESKIFHREGDRWYGKTKHGQYMTEADALKAGYRETK
jgi:DNA uptake protein ComE-like DNA-binding protein